MYGAREHPIDTSVAPRSGATERINIYIIQFKPSGHVCQKFTRSRVPRAVKCPSVNPPTGVRSSISP